MVQSGAQPVDDRLTVIAIAVLAYVVADVLHEGLGHGVTAWLSGARQITVSTVALQSDNASRWISANGTLVNLAAAAILWVVLRFAQNLPPTGLYFLILTMAGNLFAGTGYFLFSGVTNFGDWADVIQGLEPHWAWRAGLIALGAASYYASMLIVAHGLRRFPGRVRVLTWIPYFTEGVLAGVAGVFNPAGLFYVIASALPSTLGANAGMLSLASLMRGWKPREKVAAPIHRSWLWIGTGAAAAVLFIVVLGRGVRFTR